MQVPAGSTSFVQSGNVTVVRARVGQTSASVVRELGHENRFVETFDLR
jgi:hypothetical protein